MADESWSHQFLRNAGFYLDVRPQKGEMDLHLLARRSRRSLSLICRHVMLCTQLLLLTTRVLTELPDRVWKRCSEDCVDKSIDSFGLPTG